MTEVTSTKFQQNVGMYSDLALKEPVIIKNHNRARLVLMGIEEYKELQSYKRQERRKLIDDVLDKHKDTLIELADR